VSVEPDEVAVPPGTTTHVKLTLSGTGTGTTPVQWQATAPAGLTITPAQGSANVKPGASPSISLAVSPSSSLSHQRYDIPITVTSGGTPVAETFELVSVVPAGGSLPSPGEPQIVLYAASAQSLTIATTIGAELALPSDAVTGNFTQAWDDASNSSDLVFAVGRDAYSALLHDVCPWPQPNGATSGTPFSLAAEPPESPILTAPHKSPIVPGQFVASDPSAAEITQLTSQLTQYWLEGTLPNYDNPPIATLSIEGCQSSSSPRASAS
jgi:hypothetical protein